MLMLSTGVDITEPETPSSFHTYLAINDYTKDLIL
jgi:hypothetical protein